MRLFHRGSLKLSALAGYFLTIDVIVSCSTAEDALLKCFTN